MRTEPHKIKVRVVRFSINKDEVGPHMAVAVIAPFAGQRMIETAAWQRRVHCEHLYDRGQFSIERLATSAGFFAPVVAFEAVRVPNRPHSGSPQAYQGSRQ